VTDHVRPLDDAVDRFILAVRALPDGAWTHFHCEAGLGRTTTFMVLYDMLRNANRVSLEDIVRRQKILSHGYDVLQPDEPETGRRLCRRKGRICPRILRLCSGKSEWPTAALERMAQVWYTVTKSDADDASHSNSTACEIHRDAYLFRESFGSGARPRVGF